MCVCVCVMHMTLHVQRSEEHVGCIDQPVSAFLFLRQAFSLNPELQWQSVGSGNPVLFLS